MIIRGRRKINLITLSVKLTLRGCLMGLGLTLRGKMRKSERKDKKTQKAITDV